MDTNCRYCSGGSGSIAGGFQRRLSISNIGQIGAVGDLLILISAINWAIFSVLPPHVEAFAGILDDVYVCFLGSVFPACSFL